MLAIYSSSEEVMRGTALSPTARRWRLTALPLLSTILVLGFVLTSCQVAAPSVGSPAITEAPSAAQATAPVTTTAGAASTAAPVTATQAITGEQAITSTAQP